MTKDERLKAANEFILVIAGCGRKFLSTMESYPHLNYQKEDVFTSSIAIQKNEYIHTTEHSHGSDFQAIIQ